MAAKRSWARRIFPGCSPGVVALPCVGWQAGCQAGRCATTAGRPQQEAPAAAATAAVAVAAAAAAAAHQVPLHHPGVHTQGGVLEEGGPLWCLPPQHPAQQAAHTHFDALGRRLTCVSHGSLSWQEQEGASQPPASPPPCLHPFSWWPPALPTCHQLARSCCLGSRHTAEPQRRGPAADRGACTI
jgi:hypothetical protein